MRSKNFLWSSEDISYAISEYETAGISKNDIFIYKCISDIGLFYQNHVPNYLINNFNTKPEETANAFYDIRIELLDEYSIDTSQYPSNDIITTNATVSAAENQILTISASSINIVENYGNFLRFSDLKNNKLYTFSGEARISEDGTFGRRHRCKCRYWRWSNNH